MNELRTTRLTAIEDFCWDVFVKSMRARLSPQALRECMVGDQLSALGASVFEMRDELERTMEDVAFAAGVKTKLISRLENFELYPSLEEFVSIVNELGGEVIIVKRDQSPRSRIAEDHRGCSHDY